jgi:hypothetical protein
MSRKRFKGEVLAGHKDMAVEVPFDPAAEWGLQPKSLWRGRRGHAVNATVNGISFESSIVPRQKKFYLLIDSTTTKAAGVSSGVVVQIAVEPYDE